MARLDSPIARLRRGGYTRRGMYYVYILISESSLKTYTGITDNPERRLLEHNNSKSFYTKKYIPWTLIYLENVTDRESARNREKYFKSAAGRRWIKVELFK